jgi:hypothetical protein
MKDANDEFITIIKEKEEIFRKMVFPDSIVSSINISISRDFSINAIIKPILLVENRTHYNRNLSKKDLKIR